MRVALVHDWLTGMRGGEKVLESLLELYPDAEIFTLFHRPGSVSKVIESRPIHTSVLDHIPGVRQRYRYFLPLFPWAVERFDLNGFDLIISTSHCVAKGVQPAPGSVHLCYCLTPMRYMWDLYDDYFGVGRASWPVRKVAALFAKRLRRWDVASSSRVHHFVAISEHIRDRVARIYGRKAAVVFPPVDVRKCFSHTLRDDYYLTVSSLVPYKRVDVIISAFNQAGLPLVVIGDGSESRRLQRLAGPTVKMLGHVDDVALSEAYASCKAFVYCATEDFGIAAVEAQAAGAPVIAYGRGGLAETVVPWTSNASPEEATGLFFHQQTAEALIDSLERFQELCFDGTAIRRHAQQFSAEVFKAGLLREVEHAINGQTIKKQSLATTATTR